MNDVIKTLIKLWTESKAEESKAVEARRAVEDQLSTLLKVDDKKDSSKTHDFDDFQIKITTRLSRKVDADLVQEIASEFGLQDQLGELFRWKPDINLTNWKNAPEETKKQLSKAITTTASRPSFSITKKD